MAQTDKTIEISKLNKKHKTKQILTDISFTAKAGRITAFLGPNGAGKSSTLRILLGLDQALSGSATFGGKKYREFFSPLKMVGAAFDGVGGAPRRRVKTHLKMIAQSNQISQRRVSEVLILVDLVHKSQARLGELSLGEGQRLGLAVALLGDPQYLVLDEPTNGLDPLGIRWFREFIHQQAQAGKTILLSSHILGEIEAMADDVVMINRGQLVVSGELQDVMKNLSSLEEVFFALTEGGNADD